MLEPANTQGITIKVKLVLQNPADEYKFHHTMEQYRQACNFISQYIFDYDFPMNQLKIQKEIYRDIREKFGLKSMMAQSAIRSVIARYKTIKAQLFQKPFRYQDEDGKWQRIYKDLRWLWHPIEFHRPQVDLVRNRDWSRLSDGTLSLNTLDGRVFATPVCHGFDQYFDGTWKFGGAKLLRGKHCWMLHIGATKQIDEPDLKDVLHVVGIDRGTRFLTTTYDEQGKCKFYSGKQVMRKRDCFARTRAKLQKKGTWSAKRALRRLSGRENRWMSDVNHCLSKTLVQKYGKNTLFVIEDLSGVSFEESNLSHRNANGRRELRSWAFYQLEQFLGYKARLSGSSVVKVSARYTSQRCPKCGGIHKEARDHHLHEYRCQCGYRSNDDRIGAMNIQLLGTMHVSGNESPHFEKITASE